MVREWLRPGSATQPLPPQHLPRTITSLSNPPKPGWLQAPQIYRLATALLRAQDISWLKRANKPSHLIPSKEQFSNRTQTVFKREQWWRGKFLGQFFAQKLLNNNILELWTSSNKIPKYKAKLVISIDSLNNLQQKLVTEKLNL